MRYVGLLQHIRSSSPGTKCCHICQAEDSGPTVLS